MSAESLYRFRCDAPACTEIAYSDRVTDTPANWRCVASNAHIPTKTPQTTRSRRRPLTYSERSAGSFRLHLCPEHHDTFDEHQPMTDGYRRPGRDSYTNVSCSCGQGFGTVMAGFRIAGGDMAGPSSYPEKAWWRHLPEELRWYAEREAPEEAK